MVPYWYMWRRAIMANSAGKVAPARHLARDIARRGQDFGHFGRGLRGHFFDARSPGRCRKARRRTAETAWKNADPLEAQAASKRVAGTPMIPSADETYGAR